MQQQSIFVMVSDPRIREHSIVMTQHSIRVYMCKKDALRISETRNDLLLSLSFSNVTTNAYNTKNIYGSLYIFLSLVESIINLQYSKSMSI